MILQSVIANLTRKLDLICQRDGESGGISSHEQLKEETLKCLINIVKSAPESEYINLIGCDEHEILLGYLLSIACQLAKSDKSRTVRLQSLELINSIIDRLERLHGSSSGHQGCSILTIILALPGVSSSLFKLIMSDTKLPKAILIKSLQTLGSIIRVAFLHCEHELKADIPEGYNSKLTGQNLIDTCDNLAARIAFLIDYVTTNCDNLHSDIKHEMLNFCIQLATKTRLELVTRCLKSIVRYVAFISSSMDQFNNTEAKEIDLKTNLLADELRQKMQDCDNLDNRLDVTALKCISKLLDDLDENCLKMLISERQANLAMLSGMMRLLPKEILTTYLEMPDKRLKVFHIFTKLAEFSSQQPFLFLTDTKVELNAIEIRDGKKNYTIEKRFVHLTEKEVVHLNTCCHLIGKNLDWPFLCDIIRSELLRFSSSNHLYVTYQILEGCLKRDDLIVEPKTQQQKFAPQMLFAYIDHIRTLNEHINSLLVEDGQSSYSSDIIRAVIAIETLVTLTQLHLKFQQEHGRRIVILKNLLCPLLSWCSSKSRAVSEASLNAFTQIGLIYGHRSSREFIEEHTDYIVDGATKMLDNYLSQPEVTDVLAITFKLSSINTFHYFADVFERVFKVLGKYHQTSKSKTIVLFFLRTLQTLSDWLDGAQQSAEQETLFAPLDTQAGIHQVLINLDIDRRIVKLQQDLAESERLDKEMDETNKKAQEEEEQKLAKQINSGRIDEDLSKKIDSEMESSSKQTKRSDEIILTEKIVKHCISLISSSHVETKMLALRAAACGFRILRQDEDTLLPLIHQIWPALLCRLTEDYSRNLEVSLCAFECLVSMALHSRDFIRRRALDSIIPRLCLFLESQASQSLNKRDYDPYCMTIAYKCQLTVLTHLGPLAYHTQIAYNSLWRIVKAILRYLNKSQAPTLRDAARGSLKYLIALDADCVWYFAKQYEKLSELPFALIFETF